MYVVLTNRNELVAYISGVGNVGGSNHDRIHNFEERKAGQKQNKDTGS